MYSCQGGICQQRADKFATGGTRCHMVALKKENHDRISTHHVRPKNRPCRISWTHHNDFCTFFCSWQGNLYKTILTTFVLSTNTHQTPLHLASNIEIKTKNSFYEQCKIWIQNATKDLQYHRPQTLPLWHSNISKLVPAIPDLIFVRQSQAQTWYLSQPLLVQKKVAHLFSFHLWYILKPGLLRYTT